MYRRRSSAADFRNETRRIGRVEKALIQGYGFLMRARSRARTRLYAKYGRGFSEAAALLPRLGGTDGRYAYIKRAQRIYHS